MGSVFLGQKYIEKFFCHCGKECKSVKYIHSPQSNNKLAGMVWECGEGHIERKWHHKERKAK